MRISLAEFCPYVYALLADDYNHVPITNDHTIICDTLIQ